MKNTEQKIISVFGCGGDRDRTKRPIMGHIATTLANKTIITSDNSRGESPEDIINDILSGVAVGSDHTVIPDRRKAIEHAIMTAKRDDIIILAGKGHEGYEIIGGVKRPFDERGIVLEAVKKYF
jgi:UDP-N-acetylmuramoyl-L-alanyl-D-glutamate--2,6-diaminopimelate ligase